MALHNTTKDKSVQSIIARQHWVSIGAIVLAVLLMVAVIVVVLFDNNDQLHSNIDHLLLPILGLVAAVTLLFGVHMFSKSERNAQSLRESEQRLRQFIGTIPGGVVVVDREGGLIYANTPAMELLGEELLATPLYLQSTHQVYPTELLPVTRALQGESSVVDDVEVHRDDKTILLEMRTSPIRDAENKVEYAVAIIFDITQRKQTEGELHFQRDLFEKMVAVARATTTNPALEPTLKNALEVLLDITDAEHSNLLLADPDGVVLYTMLEHGSPLRVERKGSVNPIMDNGLAGWVYHHLEPALIPDVLQDERWLSLPNGEYSVRSIAMVPILLDGAPLGVMGVSHHQPDQFHSDHIKFLQAAADQMALALRNTRVYEEERRLAEELTRAREVSEAAYRSKSMFLAKMSHELRTPLTVIMGYSDMLLDYSKQANLTIIQPQLVKIQQSTSYLHRLINGILDFSEIEAGRMELIPEKFTVAELVQVAIEEANPIAEKSGNTLVVECDVGQVMMKTDFQHLHQILDNLLDNACKFTDQGIVTLKAVHEKDASGDWMCFMVSDTGSGISSEQVHKLFQAFSQVDANLLRRTEGAGLGLAVSRQIARMMGGDITVVSQVGKGSTFTVRVPCELSLG